MNFPTIAKGVKAVSRIADEWQNLMGAYRLLMDELPCAVIFISAAGVVEEFNRSAQTLLGKDKADVVGWNYTHIFPCQKMKETVEAAINNNESNFLVEKVNGVEVILHCVSLSGFEDRGALIIFEDQTEKNALYKELDITRKLNQELAQVMESSYDGIIITDKRGVILKANKSVERITGFLPEEIMQKTMFQLEREGYVKINEIVSNKHTRIIRQRLKTGKEVLVTSNHIFDHNNHLSFIISNIKDLTEIKQHIEPLKLTKKYYKDLNVIRNQASGIVSDSSEMSIVIEKAYKVARVNSTVLILGESGVGKEVIARFIHSNSLRRNGPFISINCSAIPVNLLESELFGHEKGAFTGAALQKPGLFELAHKGTIFLDEVAELQLNLQSKLLRFLQDKEIYRVGGKKPILVDARIVSATNKDMGELVKNNLFRDDLYFRLNVIPIHIPPLRSRKTDIRPLADYFFAKESEKHNISKRIALEVFDAFENYDWPGNVRELQNVTEYLVVMSRDDTIGLDDLPDSICSSRSKNIEVNINKLIPLKEAREVMEREMVSTALARHKSTRKVAEVLKMDYTTIYRIIKKYKLDEIE
jgi:PAS domain S-box-containing protein